MVSNQSHRNRWLLNLVRGIAALLVAIKLFFLQNPHHSYYHRGGLPFHERYDDKIQSSLQLEFHEDILPQDPSISTSTASFKIMQITDIHMGEAENEDWGPEQDLKTFHVLDSVIPIEKPDLIVLSGDQLTANNIGTKNATAYISLLGEHLSQYSIPWCLIFGNHDDAPFEYRLANGTKVKKPAKTSRAELLAADRQFALSLSQPSTRNLFGDSNYELTVRLPSTWLNKDPIGTAIERQDDDDVALQLILLDSGGGALPEKLEQNQIDWFHKSHRKKSPAAAVFQHIPTKDFAYDGTVCEGLQDNPVDSITKDPGIVEVLQQAGNVLWLGVGHDHGNDYCCPTSTTTSNTQSRVTNNTNGNLHLCFGRHSGYGGYGEWDRGARVYEIKLQRNTEISESGAPILEPSVGWRSWVRLESGEIIDHYKPSIVKST